jgi:hypothetical protein
VWHMTVLHMPGFSAETSLYNTQAHYRSVVHPDFGTRHQEAVPQIALTRGTGGEGARRIVALPPTIVGPVISAFQCGWNPNSQKAQCWCSGDRDCDNMFRSGFCGANASCDTGQGTCTCDLAW